MENRGLRLGDHADQLTETKTGREIKGEKLENGKDKTHHQLQKPLAKLRD